MKVEGYRLIRQGKDENGFTFGEYLFGVRAARAAAFFGEIMHAAMFVLTEPFFKNVVMLWRF